MLVEALGSFQILVALFLSVYCRTLLSSKGPAPPRSPSVYNFTTSINDEYDEYQIIRGVHKSDFPYDSRCDCQSQ